MEEWSVQEGPVNPGPRRQRRRCRLRSLRFSAVMCASRRVRHAVCTSASLSIAAAESTFADFDVGALGGLPTAALAAPLAPGPSPFSAPPAQPPGPSPISASGPPPPGPSSLSAPPQAHAGPAPVRGSAVPGPPSSHRARPAAAAPGPRPSLSAAAAGPPPTAAAAQALGPSAASASAESAVSKRKVGRPAACALCWTVLCAAVDGGGGGEAFWPAVCRLGRCACQLGAGTW